jgi:hypothetical protein
MRSQPLNAHPPSSHGSVIQYSLFVLSSAALISGTACSQPYAAQTSAPSVYRSAVPSVSYQPAKVEIISEPAGARIEVNENYIGDAPITVEIDQNGGYFTQDTVIRALPTEAGDYVQAKRFSGNSPDVGARNRIPSRIFFNMHLGPAMPTVDVNVSP